MKDRPQESSSPESYYLPPAGPVRMAEASLMVNLPCREIPDEPALLLYRSVISGFALWKEQLPPEREGLLYMYTTNGMEDKLGLDREEGTEWYSVHELPEDARDLWKQAGFCLQSGIRSAWEGAFGVPLADQDGKAIAVVGLCGLAEKSEAFMEKWGNRTAAGLVPYVLLSWERELSRLREDRIRAREQLISCKEEVFKLSERLFSLNDGPSILTELLESLHRFFPKFRVDLLLSQDSQEGSLPAKPLSIFNGTSQICIRAFMEGRLLTKGGPEGIRELAAPLAGKQGVYGVVHFLRESGAELRLDTSVLESAIRAAGAAFENALLYEQSNLLVAELRLINEITRRLNESLKLKEIYSFASSELISIFDADFCCILQHDRSSKQMIVQASNLPALEQAKFTLQEGYAGLIYETREPVIVSDYRENRMFVSRLMEMTDSRSLIGCPLYVNGEVIGVILVTHRYPHYFTYDNYKLLQVLSGHIGLAMANASLHAEVRRMVITDNLTGLYTRHYLNEQVSHMQHKDQCGSLIVVDIDDFKGINDTYGHLVGDRILIQVSTIVRSSIRETDIPARWGGEELAIYLPQIGSDAAVRIAERIRCRVLSETDPTVTVSCGISDWRYGDGKISVESLFYKSDMALYKAKHGGKNQHRIG